MSRYIKLFENVLNSQSSIDSITSYLSQEGFKLVNFKGEEVWKKGNGLLAAPQFIKVTPNESSITLEAWLKTAILPGLYVGEMGITGFYGALIKRKLKKRVDYIENIINNN